MKTWVISLVVCLGVTLPGISFADEAVKLIARETTSYSVDIRGKVSGEVVPVIDCVFGILDMDYQLTIIPWRRAQRKVWNGDAHGYFAATNNAQDEQHAMLSSPVALEKWYWYFLKGNPAPSLSSLADNNQKIGIIYGSNTETWLLKQGVDSFLEARSFEQIIKLLELKRIDAFLADQALFQKEFESHYNNLLDSKFVRYTPLGVYFNAGFVEEHPGFLPLFNNTIEPCSPRAIELSREEHNALYNTALSDILHLTQSPAILKALVKQNQQHSAFTNVDIKRLNAQWLLERNSEVKPLIEAVLSKDVSAYLKRVKENSNTLFTEIFVMDQLGLNVGQSDETSDYWQGDEDKFIQVFNTQGRKKIYIDDIRYDESSNAFLSQISLTITDPANGQVIGAMTVGVNVEKALSMEYSE